MNSQQFAILTAFIAATSTAVYANENCVKIGDLAEAIMDVRQQGNVSLSKMLGAFPADNPLTPAVKRMAILAFERPQYSSPKFRSESVADFRNEFEVACYRESGE